MRRGTVGSLIAILVLAGAALGLTLGTGKSPTLGLDLQGGTSVVLQPKEQVPEGVLNQAIEIIRNRVDALGVAEPDISRLGNNVIVQLPGVKDSKRAIQIVGQTAELRFRPVLEVLPPEGVTPPTTTTAPATTTTTAAGATSTSMAADATTTTTAPATPPTTAAVPSTSRDDNAADKEVVLPEVENGEEVRRYRLGPAELTGKAVKTATASFNSTGGDWAVDFTLTGDGSKAFDDLAAKYVGRQVAIELDGVVKSAPTINTATFGGRGQITGTFSQKDAKDLALVLRYGSLPVQLEQQSVQTVSASLGKDSLRAGVLAGLLGLGLVLLYMILYYRALGVVVLLGLLVSGALMWSLVSLIGASLTLSGAVGIIVSVGVTVDSYIVYFERLKDEIRSGKTIRSSVDRGFSRAFRTILAADTASFIGAALLWMLTVGSVRGFAFFLGLSTLLDVFVAFMFTRPMVILLGRSRLFTEARFFGVARGLAAAQAGGPA